MRPLLPTVLRPAIAVLLLGTLVLLVGSCAETSTPPDGSVELRVDVRFAEGTPALRGGPSFVYDRVRVRATPYDSETNDFGDPFIAEDPIEPGDSSFRLELEVVPATYYRVEVAALGSVDPDTTLGGVLFFGLELVENVAAGQDNSVTVTLTRQFPDVSTQVFPDEDTMELSWTAIPEAFRYRIRGTDNEGAQFESISVGTDTTFAIPPRFTGGSLVRVFRVRAEFTDRSAGAYSLEVEADLGSPVAPGEIADFAATAITDSSLVLAWTATGDDGAVGRASSYDLRFSDQPLDETTFPTATPVPGLPSPATAGTPEMVSVEGLNAETVYYFGLFAIDDVPLRSPLTLVSAETAPEPDRIPPAAIADLGVTGVSGSSATLLWTAPGDDGGLGTAASYDARISIAPLNAENFDLANAIAGFPSPAPGGTAESFLLGDLTARQTYFVALRTEDEEGNRSGISNVVSFETLDLVAPDAVDDLVAEALDENRVALSWSAPADEDGSAVARYDIRWSEAAIDETNFGEAHEVEAPSPETPGAEQGLILGGFSRDTQLYFALRSFDGSDNRSPLSNLASARTPDLTPPAPVADLLATSVDETTLLVTWTATGDDGLRGTAETYDLRLATLPIDESNFANATPILLADPQSAGEEESFEVSGLISGQLYYLRLRTLDDAGNESDLSNLASATPTDATPPAAVVLTVELTTSNSVVVGWVAPGDDGNEGRAADYDFRYSTTLLDADNFQNATPVSLPVPAPAGTPESAEITELDEATTYFFALITADERGNPSPLSNVVSATTGTTPPVAPTGLAAAPLSPTSIGLAWQDNAENEENYEVERRRSDENNFTRIAILGPGDGDVSHVDSPVLDRQTYTYRVRATNAGGPSAYSNEASATTPVPAPTGLAASALAHDEIRLTWTFSALDPEGFRIERLAQSDWTTVAEVSGTLREYIDPELVYLTSYTYRMVAFDGNQVSAYTAEVSETTPDEPPFCSIDPPSLDFGPVTVGSADTLTVTIMNTGGQVLTGDVVLQDCGPGFATLGGSALSLHRGEGRDVRVIFAPLAPGSSSCTLLGPACDPVDLLGVGENTFWSDRFALGDLGVNNTVRAFAPSIDGIYAGGAFTLAGAEVTSYTAQLIDDTWFGMGPTLSAQVRTLANTGSGLYCGGDFTSQGSAPYHIAEWTGSSWGLLNTSPDGIVRALVEWNLNIIVGGSFGTAYVSQDGEWFPTTGPAGVAEWVPCTGRRPEQMDDLPADRGCNFFRSLDASPNGPIEAVTIWQGDLYVGGSFTQIGGQDIAYLAKLSDSKTGWEPVGFNGGVSHPVYALYPSQSQLWVGGQFNTVDGQSSLGVASWSGTSWIPRTTGEDFRTTYAITGLNGNIVIGGSWTASNGVQALNRIAEFDGIGWLPLGTGIDSAGGFVYALQEHGGALYVGGSFTTAGGLPSQNIARWEPVIPR